MKVRILMLAILACLLHLNSCSPGIYGPPVEVSDGGAQQAAGSDENVPDKRPGLATGWGDSKRSSIEIVSFERASSRPAGTDAIYYNNEDGVDAMAGAKEKVSAMQWAAAGLVEWGIKGRYSYLKTYKSHTHNKRFVVGDKGDNYRIMVKNRSRAPLEIVASVDGLDVMDGKGAKYSKRGYIVDPGKTLEIEGFRTSTQRVAKFEFSGVSSSYANLKHGNTRNVGVIGLAVFTQKGNPPWGSSNRDEKLRAAASPFATAP